ncbi:MAG: 4Fe-4S dicluster domain-containing protein, partial [Oscillospiraceae bacterium]|nr:4Fe-4S dicluster domain-containing protein [Oscillospiraceae bacterium]
PAEVNIPWCFSIWNSYGIYENRGHSNWEWSMVQAENRPPQCTECGKCNEICPQHIDVIGDLRKVSSEMEKIKW